MRRTLSQERVGSPKTGRSRVVKLTHPLLDSPEAVLEALKSLRSVPKAEAAVAGRTLEPEAFVFTLENGRPFRSTLLHRPWRRCLEQAGVRYRNPEQLRHTFASTFLSRGESLLYIQEQGLVKRDHIAQALQQVDPSAPRHQPAATPAQLTV